MGNREQGCCSPFVLVSRLLSSNKAGYYCSATQKYSSPILKHDANQKRIASLAVGARGSGDIERETWRKTRHSVRMSPAKVECRVIPSALILFHHDMVQTDDDHEARPLKRPRADGDAEPTPTCQYTVEPDLWFEDGNIILVSAQPNPTGFRVHRSLLARNSEFFRDMFQLARPEDDVGGLESSTGLQCTVLPLMDSAPDIQTFLNMIYTVGYVAHHPVLLYWSS